jgi:hypothetical protein
LLWLGVIYGFIYGDFPHGDLLANCGSSESTDANDAADATETTGSEYQQHGGKWRSKT